MRWITGKEGLDGQGTCIKHTWTNQRGVKLRVGVRGFCGSGEQCGGELRHLYLNNNKKIKETLPI